MKVLSTLEFPGHNAEIVQSLFLVKFSATNTIKYQKLKQWLCLRIGIYFTQPENYANQQAHDSYIGQKVSLNLVQKHY